MNKDKDIGGGLNPLPRDDRDFSLSGVFGTEELSNLPKSFRIAKPLKIKDQGSSDMCTAYATTAISEDQEGVVLSIGYQFAKTKYIEGSWQSWGANLRDACKAMVKFGALKENVLQEKFRYDGTNRDFLANWDNWADQLDEIAVQYKKKSFFKVDGPYDTFDNIRVALRKHHGGKRSVLVGSKWYREWTRAPEGIVPRSAKDELFGHAFKIFGWEDVEGDPHLVAQLSNGTDIGDGGIFYFPREVVNTHFEPYGQFMLVDMSPNDAKYYNDNQIQVDDNWLTQLWKVIRNILGL